MLNRVIAAVLALFSVPAGAQPRANWQSEPEFGRCALRQQLDEAGAFVQISRTPGNDQTTVSFEDRRVRVESPKPLIGATIALEPGGTIAADGYLRSGDSPEIRSIWIRTSDQQFMDRLSNASVLTLTHAEFGSLRLPLRSTAAAVLALRRCEDKTMREWGIDPIAWRGLRVRPIPASPTNDWFSPVDFQRVPAVFGVKSPVVALVEVGPDGTVQKCTVVNRQVHSLIKDETCRPIRDRGRFQPAVGADGKPVSAPFVMKIRFGWE